MSGFDNLIGGQAAPEPAAPNTNNPQPQAGSTGTVPAYPDPTGPGNPGGGTTPTIPAILSPITIGMNSSGAGASSTEVFMRDLAWHGRWTAVNGSNANADYDLSLMDWDSFFPTAYSGGATEVALLIYDGATIGPLGAYSISYDPRLTVTSVSADPDIVFTPGTAGKAEVTIGGGQRPCGWQLKISGPLASLLPSQRGIKILPKNDAHPERLYSDQWRAAYETTHSRYIRMMENLRANYPDAAPFMLDKGPKTGLPSTTVEAAVQAANDTNSGLTWNFHPTASLAYITRCCLYIAANLKRGLSIKVEYSNEIWNGAFAVGPYLRHQAWILGKATGSIKSNCVLWDSTSMLPTGGFGAQPYEPNYKVNPNDGSEAYKGRTTQAISSGQTFIGNGYGYGYAVYQATANVASGTVFDFAGSGNIVRVATREQLNNGMWTLNGERLLAIFNTMKAAWVAAGHDPALVRPVINQQSGPYAGDEETVLNAGDGSLWRAHPSIQLAPYFSWHQSGEDVGSGSIASILDSCFAGQRADIEYKQHWEKQRREALQLLAPAGVILAADTVEVYEVFHHEYWANNDVSKAAFKQMRRDRRLGVALKYFLTLFARENPGSLVQIFNLFTGEYPNAVSGWGVFFDMTEASSGNLLNPGGIALKEWYEAAAAGKTCLDLYTSLAPLAGTTQLSVMRGPQLAGAITGVVQGKLANGTVAVNLPFTLADGSPVVDLNYTAVDGQVLTFNIVPQPSVFSIGSLSTNVVVTTAAPTIVVPTWTPDFDWRVNAAPLAGTSNGALVDLREVVSGTTIVAQSTDKRAAFVANVKAGKPGYRFGGNALYPIPRSTQPAYYAGEEAQVYTRYIQFTAPDIQEDYNLYCQINDSFDGIRLNRSSTGDALAGFHSNDPQFDFTAEITAPTRIYTLAILSSTISVGSQYPSTGRQIVCLDGQPISSYGGPMPKPGNKNGGGNSWLGGFFNGAYAANITILEDVKYNRLHTFSQVWDNTAAANYSVGQSMPVRALALDGSSLTSSANSDSTSFGVGGSLMRQLGLPFGTIGTYSLPGADFATMLSKGAELDYLLAKLGPANAFLLAGEGYNDLVTYDAATAIAHFKTYIDARLAAGWLPQNILLDTITGVAQARPGSDRYPAFAAGVKAIPGSASKYNQIRVANNAGVYSDNDADIGVGYSGTDGQGVPIPINKHLADGVHMTGKKNFPATQSGYPRRASILAPMVATLNLG